MVLNEQLRSVFLCDHALVCECVRDRMSVSFYLSDKCEGECEYSRVCVCVCVCVCVFVCVCVCTFRSRTLAQREFAERKVWV